MTESVEATEARTWNDALVADDLFTLGPKLVLWVGYAILAIAMVTMSILAVTNYFHVIGEVEDQVGTDPTHGSMDTYVVFTIVYDVAAVIFAGGLTWAALGITRAPHWACIVMICVAGILLIGGSALAGNNLTNMFNAVN